jgi:hypothetical protein
MVICYQQICKTKLTLVFINTCSKPFKFNSTILKFKEARRATDVAGKKIFEAEIKGKDLLLMKTESF